MYKYPFTSTYPSDELSLFQLNFLGSFPLGVMVGSKRRWFITSVLIPLPDFRLKY